MRGPTYLILTRIPSCRSLKIFVVQEEGLLTPTILPQLICRFHHLQYLPFQFLHFLFSAKYQKILLIVCDMIRLYKTIGRNVTVDNIQWVLIMKNSSEQYKYLTDYTK